MASTYTVALDFSDKQGHGEYYRLLEQQLPRMVACMADLLKEAAVLHEAKDKDYGDGVPLGNFNEIREWGIPRVDAVVARMTDKWSRIKTLHRQEREGRAPAVNETKHDTLKDLAAYCLIAIVLEQEDWLNDA